MLVRFLAVVGHNMETTRTLVQPLTSATYRRLRTPVPPVTRNAVGNQRLLSVRAGTGGSSRGPGGDKETDKSWGEIVQEAAGVAKSVFNKLKDTATSILPSSSGPSAKPATTAKPEVPLGPGLGGGLLPNLLGRAVGGLLSSALSSLSAQLEEAAKAQAGAYEEAVERLEGSTKLRARLGNVTVGPVMSQSSSSSSINGVVTKQVTLLVPVYGSLGGSGTAQVSVLEGPQQQGGRSLRITVRTADGGIVSVDDDSGPGRGGGGGGRGRGKVIDVEFREIKKP